jgi:hypothetical protein
MHRFLILCGLVGGLLAGLPARCDQWAAPTRKEVFSEGSTFVAVIEPGSKTNLPTAVMHKLSNGQRTKIWEVTLSNKRSPVSAAVSPDGQHLVTFDNWHQVGYGDDVVAIYAESGQLAKYSLQQFAPPPSVRTNELAGREFSKQTDGVAYFRVFSHSVSSRWWNRDSIHFFYPGEEPKFFCLWLDWDQRWVAWALREGSLVKPSEIQINDWNAEGRRRSLRQIESDPDDAAGLNFLGRLRVLADRALIEKWLEDSKFFHSYSHSSTKDNEMTRFVFTSFSVKREKADEILSRWDGVVPPPHSSRESYNFLGTVQGTLRLPSAPAKSDGYLHIQLVPEGVVPSARSLSSVGQQLIANLQTQSPRAFRNGRSYDLPLGTNVEFAIRGVTPGAYRVRAIWDRHRPFCDSTNGACEPGPGDVISTNLPLVVVRKGVVAPDVIVDCQTVVK